MRKKLEHLWRYYKWYLMAGAGVLLLLLNFWAQKARTPKPDYYVSIVTGNQISESTREGYAARLETVLDDRNGDGKVTVMVNLYRYDGRPGQAENTSAFMAAAVQLAADLREGISLCYLTDGEELLNADGFVRGAGDFGLYPALPTGKHRNDKQITERKVGQYVSDQRRHHRHGFYRKAPL